MARTICIHAFLRGTGKSTIAANLATALALAGHRTAVVDMDFASPSQHFLFGLGDRLSRPTYNDYLHGRCEIGHSAWDVTPSGGGGRIAGRLFLVPSSTELRDIAGMMREAHDVERLGAGWRELAAELALDVLVVDTSPGLNRDSLLAISASDALGVVLRLDKRDFQGTSVMLEVAQRLGIPQTVLIVNQVVSAYRMAEVRTQVEAAYRCDVAALLPHVENLVGNDHAGQYVLRHPRHAASEALRQAASALLFPSGTPSPVRPDGRPQSLASDGRDGPVAPEG
jgi:septum site-determining protein MinD